MQVKEKTMKKFLSLFICSLLLLGLCVQVSAQNINDYRTYQTKMPVYNNSTSTIYQYTIPILDVWSTTPTAGFNSGNAVGAYVTHTGATFSPYVFGVAESDIASGRIGNVIVKGIALVHCSGTITTGSLIGVSSSGGYGFPVQTDTAGSLPYPATPSGILGTAIGKLGTDTYKWFVVVDPRVERDPR